MPVCLTLEGNVAQRVEGGRVFGDVEGAVRPGPRQPETLKVLFALVYSNGRATPPL